MPSSVTGTDTNRAASDTKDSGATIEPALPLSRDRRGLGGAPLTPAPDEKQLLHFDSGFTLSGATERLRELLGILAPGLVVQVALRG